MVLFVNSCKQTPVGCFRGVKKRKFGSVMIGLDDLLMFSHLLNPPKYLLLNILLDHCFTPSTLKNGSRVLHPGLSIYMSVSLLLRPEWPLLYQKGR